MTEASLIDQIDCALFHRLRLHLRGGATVDVPTPYLTTIIRGSLYAAVARRAAGDAAAGPELIPVEHVVWVERVSQPA